MHPEIKAVHDLTRALKAEIEYWQMLEIALEQPPKTVGQAQFFNGLASELYEIQYAIDVFNSKIKRLLLEVDRLSGRLDDQTLEALIQKQALGAYAELRATIRKARKHAPDLMITPGGYCRN